MKQLGDFNPAYGAEKFGFKDLKQVAYNFEAPFLYEESMQRREAIIAKGGAIVAETGQHTGRSPKDKFVVDDALTADTVWWDNNGKMSKRNFDTLLADFIAHAKGKELFAQDLYGGADQTFRVRTRVFTEYAWHSLFIRTMLIRPGPRRTGDVHSRSDDRRPAVVPRRSQAPRLPLGDGHRHRLLAQDRADRRHQLRRRDEEVGLHLSQLRAAGPEGHADALLGQRRRQERLGRVLRPVGHRQDDAVGRSRAHAARRRRARLVEGRHLQLRRRLLRQGDQAVGRSRARNLRHHQALRHGDGECRSRSHHARSRFRRRLEDREHPHRLSARLHPERVGDRPRARIRRTS